MQIEHHSEQMEAVRRDFNKLWTEKLERRARNMGTNDERALAFAMDIAWQAFLHAIEIRNAL